MEKYRVDSLKIILCTIYSLKIQIYVSRNLFNVYFTMVIPYRHFIATEKATWTLTSSSLLFLLPSIVFTQMTSRKSMPTRTLSMSNLAWFLDWALAQPSCMSNIASFSFRKNSPLRKTTNRHCFSGSRVFGVEVKPCVIDGVKVYFQIFYCMCGWVMIWLVAKRRLRLQEVRQARWEGLFSHHLLLSWCMW